MNLMGMSVWNACVRTGTNTPSSTRPQIARVQPVVSPSLSYTWGFHTPQGSIVVRPQSTAPITTNTHIHLFPASVVAAKYTESNSSKVGS